MKKAKVFLLAAIAVTIAVMVVAYFTLFGSSDSYAESLPADATSIVRLDAKSFLSAAKLGPADLLQLLLRSREAQTEGSAKSAGIDMKRPFYAFTTAPGEFGLLAAVEDLGELEAFLAEEHTAGRASEVTRQRGFSWSVIERKWLMAYDDSRVLVMGPAVGSAQDRLRTDMVRLLEQKHEDSGLQSPLFEELQKADEPLVAVLAPEILPGSSRSLLSQFHVNSMDDALLRLSLETDDNELELEADVIAKSANVEEQMKRLNRLLRPVKGALLDHAHADNVVWMAANLQGNDLLDALRSNQSVRTALIALNLVFDLDKIIRAIDGDVALELTSADAFRALDFQVKDFCLTAQVADTYFLRDASSWGNQLFGVRSLTPQDFALNLGTSSLFFGVDDHTFYLSSDRGLPTAGNDDLSRQRGDIKGARFFATIALPQLFRQLDADDELPAAFRQFERLSLTMEEVGEFKLKLIAPRGMNIARELLLTE